MPSKLIESLRGDLRSLEKAGAINKVTMRHFDAICPPPVREFSAVEIKRLRERLKFSQPVFAHLLHTTASPVRKWEQGKTRPAGPTLKLLAYGYEPKPGRTGADWNREQLQRIDLRWHDLRHEGACRLLADGVDIQIIQLMLGHASIQQTQRYLNVTDEELRRGLEVSWSQQGRPLRLAAGG